MANRTRDPGREAFWQRTLTAFGNSGLSVRAFCRREKLAETAFYFWRRTIQQRGLMQPNSKQPCPKRCTRKQPAFVPLVLSNVPVAADITLELRGGRSLRLSESFPVERLAGLIRFLEAEERA
jgi:transposase